MGTALRNNNQQDMISIQGREVPLVMRLNPRARRYIVKLDAKGRVVVVSPSKRGLSKAMAFAREQEKWLAKQLADLPPATPFIVGTVLPLRGEPHIICHKPETKRGVSLNLAPREFGELAEIHVSGQPEFLKRRLTDWFKKCAKADLSERCLEHAKRLELSPSKISVRDSTTRWGSCSHTQTLSFSWRLIFAPPFILDYVAAHETAHRIHMNHKKCFWRKVDQLTPRRDEAESWLSEKGNDLHLIGAEY